MKRWLHSSWVVLALGCGEVETAGLDAGRADQDAAPPEDAGLVLPAAPCAALELDLPATLIGPGASRPLVALVHPPAGEASAPEPAASAQLSVRIEGDAVVWRRGRLVARAPGLAQVHVEFGRCQASSELEVLDYAPFAAELEALSLGRGAGHGQSELPEIVLGPPRGAGAYAGSLDVLSLGAGGSVRLGFGALRVYDGPGPDLLVFENPFWVAGGAAVFAEPGQVSLFGPDGAEHELACDPSPPYAGCAGRGPVLSHPDNDRAPTEPTLAGGDAFDLEGVVGLARAIQIRDVSTATTGSNSGFDLDAIGLVHAWPADVVGLAPELERLELTLDQVSLVPAVSAVRPGGAQLRRVAARVHAQDPELILLDGPVLRALRSGVTWLVFEAGPFTTALEVEVLAP